MALKDNLINFALQKVRNVASGIGNKLNDNQGWFRGGQFTPVKQVQTIRQQQAQMPVTTLGPLVVPNFRNQQVRQQFKPIIQPFQKFGNQALLAGQTALSVPLQSMGVNYGPNTNLIKKVQDAGMLSQQGKMGGKEVWNSARNTADVILKTYGLANPANAVRSMGAGAGFSGIANTASNIFRGKPLTSNLPQSIQQGGIQGLANAGTMRLTNSLVDKVSKFVPAFKGLTDSAISKGMPTAQDGLKVGVQKWANTLGKRLVKAAILETAVETPVWATLTQSDKETFIEAVQREFVSNLGQNLVFAGIGSLSDATKLAPVVKQTLDNSINKYWQYASSPEGLKAQAGSVQLPIKTGGEVKLQTPEVKPKIKALPQTPVVKSVQPSTKLQAKPKLKVQTTSQPPPKLPLQDIDNSQGNIPQERGFITTAKEAQATAKPVKAQIEGTYNPITNKQTMAKAQTIVSKGYDSAKTRVYNEPLTAETNAIGQELVRKAQKEGRFDEAIDIIETMAKKGTESGQAVQAFSMWQRLTPEGMLKFAEREIRKSNEVAGTLTKIFKKGENKLSKETAKFITEQMTKAQKMVDGPQKDALVKGVLQKINDEIPIGASELFDAYRYQNLLSSPRTQMRNAFQNAYQALVNKPATMAAEAGIDWISSVLKGKERTAYLKDVPTYYKGLWNSRVDAVNGFMEVWKGKQDFTNLDIKDLRSKNLPKGLTVVSRAMEGADKYFQSLIGGGEYAVLKKRGLSDIDAKAGAQKVADYYLLRNAPDPKNKSGQGALLSAIDNATVGVTELGRRIPALRWFVPFVRTPMNAAKQWIEYSPAGILTAIGNANKKTQLAKAMIGSAVVGIGANFALQDKTTWSAPTDSKEKELFYASGRKPYSVKIGDKWVPMVYLGPHALALAIPASVKQYQQDSRTALTDTQIEKLTKSTTALLGFFSEQTFLQGMGNFVRAISGDADYTFASNISGSVGQIIPLSSLQRYVSQIIDPVFRKTGGRTMTEQFVNQLKTQIPFASKSLEPYKLPNGELSKRNISDYVMPYSLGQEKPEYSTQLEQRQQKLQQNAVLNKAKKEAEGGVGSTVGDTIVYTNDNGNASTLDLTKLDDIAKMPTSNRYETAIKESKQYAQASTIMDNAGLSDEQKQTALQRLGISKADAQYYAIANDNNNLKTLYALDSIQSITNSGGTKDDILNFLLENRKELNGKMVSASGVLDNLVDEGVITKAEATMLKKYKVDKSGTPTKTSSKSGTRAKKPKAIKVSFSKPKKVKVKALKSPKFKMPKLTALKIKKPRRIKLKKPKKIKIKVA